MHSMRSRIATPIYVEGQKVTFEYRWAAGKYDQLPILADELIKRQPVVLFAPGLPAALSMKAATATTSIVFVSGPDPARAGLVTSLNRPNGNINGCNPVHVGTCGDARGCASSRTDSVCRESQRPCHPAEEAALVLLLRRG
jgi:putative tryptophan/tyrosine transport system substrate-binding protein